MVYMLIKSFFIGAIVSAPVGPTGILCLQRTLTRGKAHGFATGFGATFSDFIYAIIATLGMSIVIDFIHENEFWLKLFGSVIVFFFGVKIFRDDPVKQLQQTDHNQNSLLQDFIYAFGLTVTNPLVVFLFITLFANFSLMTETQHLWERAVCLLAMMGGAFIWWCAIVFGANSFRSKINIRGLKIVNQSAGTVFMVLAFISFFATLFF
ncbi:MAG: LysE family transporter [Paludibacteraceae bacterium]|nr:LysE family transporter [Paludibacteraceae bacterium]